MTALNYSIRPAALTDVPFLWDMLYQTIYVPADATPLSRGILNHSEISRYVLGWGQLHDTSLVAVDRESSQPIGAARFRLLVGEHRGYGYVDDRTPELSTAVVPEYRGRGVRTSLLSQLLTAAQVHYPAVSLSVSLDNPALRLYQRLGFEGVRMCGTSLTMLRRWNP